MKAIVICPEHRAAGGAFHRMRPLALMPLLGRTMLDYALTDLKREGVTDVKVLASDRPEAVREAVGRGEAWGLRVEVIGESNELAPDLAEVQHGDSSSGSGRPRVVVLGEVPGMPGRDLWKSHTATFEILCDALKSEAHASQLTMSEVSPGVWISTKARISSRAMVVSPAWIGAYASIGAGARVGPNAIVEGGAFVDGGAVIRDSWVGPDTYVGATASVNGCCAWGHGLLCWRDGSFLEVHDNFLLNDLTRRTAAQKRASLPERLAAALLMIVTFPLALIALIRARFQRQDWFNSRRVILPPPCRIDAFTVTHSLPQLSGARGLFQRWPELWLVVCGYMSLVGNRPLTREQISLLKGPVGRLWLACPAGVFSLADAEGVAPDLLSESIAHAAYFSARRSLSLRLTVLVRCIGRFLWPSGTDSSPATLSTPVQST